MFQEFNQINEKVQGDIRDFENLLGRWKCLWFVDQNNKETWQTGGKICMKIYVSRIQPNQ